MFGAFLSEFWAFLGAIWHHWKLLLGGGFIIIGISAWEHWHGATVTWHWYLAAALVLLFFACFLAWRDQYRKSEHRNTDVEAIRRWIGHGKALFAREVPNNVITGYWTEAFEKEAEDWISGTAEALAKLNDPIRIRFLHERPSNWEERIEHSINFVHNENLLLVRSKLLVLEQFLDEVRVPV